MIRVSEYYKLEKSQPYLDFVDIPIDTDIPVFLDPTAIRTLDTPWGNRLKNLIQSFFETVLKYIRDGQHNKAQALLSSLRESNHFHLGLSTGESQGRAFGPSSASLIWSALTSSKSAITGLLSDLEDTALLIDGIGPDMISDAVCNILREPLIEYTQQMADYYNIPLHSGVSSGPLWDSLNRVWYSKQVSLPITDHGIIILVPKILCRLSLTYRADKYYTHFLLPEMQHDHIQRKTSLVELLNNGSHRVTKKKLRQKFGSNKEAIAEQTFIYPHVLKEYKDKMISDPLPRLDNSDFDSTKTPDVESLINQLESITPGNTDAYKYEDIVERILSFCFYPSLAYPTKQQNIHDGRKRIDITYNNEATTGFFYWLALNYSCPKIHIECKNYGREIANPELDQMAGRFGPSRGKVGFIVCRSLKDKQLMQQRCKDTAADSRGYIVVLDDDDLKELARSRAKEGVSFRYELLQRRFDALL